MKVLPEDEADSVVPSELGPSSTIDRAHTDVLKSGFYPLAANKSGFSYDNSKLILSFSYRSIATR